MPYEGVEERMDRLETVLMSFIKHSDEFVHETRRYMAEMSAWQIQAQKQWGEIAQKLGKFAEDIVAPNIPRIAEEEFHLRDEQLFSAARVRMRHPAEAAKMQEFDYIYATKEGWIIVESKADPKLKDVDAFREILAEAPEYFPQFAGKRLFPIFASLYVPEHVVKYCSRHGIYALGMGPETMQLLNAEEISLG